MEKNLYQLWIEDAMAREQDYFKNKPYRDYKHGALILSAAVDAEGKRIHIDALVKGEGAHHRRNLRRAAVRLARVAGTFGVSFEKDILSVSERFVVRKPRMALLSAVVLTPDGDGTLIRAESFVNIPSTLRLNGLTSEPQGTCWPSWKEELLRPKTEVEPSALPSEPRGVGGGGTALGREPVAEVSHRREHGSDR